MKTIGRTLLALALLPPLMLSAAQAGTPAATVDTAKASVAAMTQTLHWRLIGPHRGGRTRAVAGIPGQGGTFLMGAVNGGVWRTTDYGRTWEPLFDQQPTQSIGAIAVAPSDPNTIYVASGEGLHRPDLSVGDGIYRSADGGRTWTHLGLEDGQQIPELAVDPHDAKRLFAAVLGHPYGPNSERGIFRSLDGGNHWTRVLYKDEDTGASCVGLDPFDPNVVYAGLWNVRSGPWEDNDQFEGHSGGLFKSSDGGETWHQLKNGLPDRLTQIQIAVAPSRRNRLYASVATDASGEYSSAAGLGVYRSDDGGESWSKVTTDPRPALRIGGGDLPVLKVDPRNADLLYSASIVTMKSTDGGETWTSLRGAPGGDDYQNLWIDPNDSKVLALVGDQGALITVNGGVTWSSWFNQPTAQLYHVAVTNAFPYKLCSGQQESGSVCIASRGNDGEITFRDWHPAGVIEYGYAVPDPLDPNVVFGAGRNEVTRTDMITGQVRNISPIPLKSADARTDRTQPLFFSPQNSHLMYYAANRLYKTTDAGQSWQIASPDLTRANPGLPASVGRLYLKQAETQRGVIYAASASGLREGLIWLGTDDGLIWKRQAGGAEADHDTGDSSAWAEVTPPELTPWSKVTQLEASHFDVQAAYASVSRFRLDDLKPYIYRTRDGGQSWQLIVNGLPIDAPVNTVREDPERRGLLFAGTEKAVWMSLDDGDHWTSLQLNLPHTSMRDLVVHGQDLILATHGRSLWILDDISPLRQIDETLLRREAALLKPTPAIRVQRDTNTDTPIPPDEPTGRNPPDGAVLDYYLGHDVQGVVTLEIYDAAGGLVRRVSSADPPVYTPGDLALELVPLYWVRQPQTLPHSGGLHRWVWDLRYPAPRTAQRGFPIAAIPGDTPQTPQGPFVTAGNYRVRLTVGAQHWEQPLVIRIDPRLIVTDSDLSAQLQLARNLAGTLDASTTALLEARSLRAQALDLAAHRGGPTAPNTSVALESYIESLRQLLGREGGAANDEEAKAGAAGDAPRDLGGVNRDLASLYDQVIRADAAPTAAQAAAATLATTEWQSLQTAWHRLRDAQTTALNFKLRAAHLPPLRPELAPPKDLDMADVD